MTSADFLAFLACWQHADKAHMLEGPAGVLTVLRQLAGFEVPAALWETRVLPARVLGYRREWPRSGHAVWRIRVGPALGLWSVCGKGDADRLLSARRAGVLAGHGRRRARSGIVKLRLAAVFDTQHGGFATGWSPVSWGSIDELFVNLTTPSRMKDLLLTLLHLTVMTATLDAARELGIRDAQVTGAA